jgi:O-antigen/teichoic acid export membrane protein
MGLLGLGIASLFSSIIGRLVAGYYFWRDDRAETAALDKVVLFGHNHNPLILIIWPNAKKFGLVGFGAFLITRANLFVASSFLGLAAAASYGLTFQIMATISGIAGVLLNISLPKMNADQVRGNKEGLLYSFGKSLVVALFIFIACAVCLILFGSNLLGMIASHTQLLSKGILTMFSIIMLLELNHSICAACITTYNEVPFVHAALLSGAGIVILSILLLKVCHFGVLGLVLSQGLVQIFYNNWKWPMEVTKRLDSTYPSILTAGLKGFWKLEHGK